VRNRRPGERSSKNNNVEGLVQGAGELGCLGSRSRVALRRRINRREDAVVAGLGCCRGGQKCILRVVRLARWRRQATATGCGSHVSSVCRS
jgi:hypothetical protein